MVDTECFQNDLAEIHSKDDALTALIHLGYLGYDADILSAYIPNYEVSKAFQSALKSGSWKMLLRRFPNVIHYLWQRLVVTLRK